MNGCENCKWHSKEPRRKAIAVGDADLELVEFEDDDEDMLICREPSVSHREMGFVSTHPGANCALWQEGRKALDPELAKLLARWGE